MIDTHQHFWTFNDQDFGWIEDDMAVLRDDFTPQKLAQQTTQVEGIDGVISVQARCCHEENDFLLDLADQSDLVLGVSGWVDLKSSGVGDTLDQYTRHPLFKGVREICQGADDEDFLANGYFDRGIRELTKRDLAYDILIFQNQLHAATEFAARHPDQRMIVDHAAKPEITQAGVPEEWKKGIAAIAALPNVSCKFSGLTTEIRDGSRWDLDLLRPYFDILLENFESERLMFGSDWPVCLLGSSYPKWVDAFRSLISELAEDEQKQICTGNARAFYRCAKAGTSQVYPIE